METARRRGKPDGSGIPGVVQALDVAPVKPNKVVHLVFSCWGVMAVI
jgi:hypothetical protein